jgi:hypothetical protein
MRRVPPTWRAAKAAPLEEETSMKKLVLCLTLGVVAVIGCGTDPSEEDGESTLELREDTRAAEPGECALGNGLYCGANGVRGAANVLYRCENGTVRKVAQCIGPCVRMPDGIHDKCDGIAALPTPEPAPAPAPAPQREQDPPSDVIPFKKSNWVACTSDSECLSNRCGCNGSNVSRCLPNADYPKTCAGAGGLPGPRANWSDCTIDSQCQSNWCGCNGGSKRQCLPDPRYPKTCRL